MTYEKQHPKTLSQVIELVSEATKPIRERENDIGPKEFNFMISVLGEALGMVTIVGPNNQQLEGTAPIDKEAAVTEIFGRFLADAITTLRKEAKRQALGER